LDFVQGSPIWILMPASLPPASRSLLTSVKYYIPMNIPTAYLTGYLTSNLAVVVKVYTAILISVIL
jgi:hypothetical protein